MEFAPKKSKSHVTCCVPGCKSRACKNFTVRFYQFPQKNESFVTLKNKLDQEEIVDRFDAWVKVLSMRKAVSKSMKVCSLHFVKEDFIPSYRRVRRLKKIAIPSVNLPFCSVDQTPGASTTKQASEREQRLQNQSMGNEQYLDHMQHEIFHNMLHLPGSSELTKNINYLDKEEKVIIKEEDPLAIENNENINLSATSSYENVCKKIKYEFVPVPEDLKVMGEQFNDVGIQVSTNSITSKFSNFITTDDELTTMTGIPNFSVLKTIETLVNKKKSPTLHANPKLDNLEVIIMTFMKLKQNLSYAVLSILFKTCTPETCREMILDMIDTLYICLKPAIYWPSKENVKKNIPQCFKEFVNVRTVVNCIEIPIQKLKNVCCQLNTHSYYRGCCTIKFMIAVTPAGLISFISKPYGGRSSENIIFEQSGIIDKMDKKDDLIADQGFTVTELCKKHDINLIIPAFSKQQKQLSKAEAIRGRSIARARIHIERSNQRIKSFKIFRSKMPARLIHKSEEVFTIICAIVNLSSPILTNDNFDKLNG